MRTICESSEVTQRVRNACELLKQKAKIEKSISGETLIKTKADAAIKQIADQEEAQGKACDAFRALRRPENKPKARIEIARMDGHEHIDLRNGHSQWHSGWHGHVQNHGPPEADCTIGVCYRPKEPWRIIYSLGEGDETTIAELPNKADIVAIDIRRAFFIQKVQGITFDNGFLTTLSIDKKSELVELAKLPVEIVKAISIGIQARVAITTQEKNLAQEQANLLKEKAKLEEARRSTATRSVEAGTLQQPRAAAAAATRPVLP